MYEVNLKFIELFKSYNCSIYQFAKSLNIPYSTMRDWLKCNKDMKEYVYDLIVYKLEN